MSSYERINMCLDPVTIAMGLGGIAGTVVASNQPMPEYPKIPELPTMGSNKDTSLDYTPRLQKRMDSLRYGYESTKKVQTYKNPYPLSGIYTNKFLLGQ